MSPNVSSLLAARAIYDRWVAPAPRTVVVQPTSLCNLACTYCYLPERRLRQHMAIEVARAVASSAEALGATAHPVEVLWHGGEPLALGIDRMRALLEPFQTAVTAGLVRHVVQTNATLITEAWCDLFDEYGIDVGVSVDGPEWMNSERVSWAGEPAYGRIEAGLRTLSRRGIAFGAIAVVNPAAVGQPRELLDHLAELGATSIGVNFEEHEGVNVHRPSVRPDQARRFWREAVDWAAEHPRIQVRDVARLMTYLHVQRTGDRELWSSQRLDPIPTVAWNGDVVLLSPELAGIKDSAHGDFLAGNLLDCTLTEILASAHTLTYVQDFLAGMAACQTLCQFFDYCRGAQAGNRYFENGSFASTETTYCRLSRQELVLALNDRIHERTAACPPSPN